MEREESDLQPESQDQKGQRITSPWRLCQRSHRSGDQRTACWHALREKHQGHQQERLAEYGKTDVQTCRTSRIGCFVKNNQTIGGKACHAEKQVEAREVSDKESADVAGERHQPPDG